MTNEPRTIDEVYDDMESNLRDKITLLTNFTRRSFNYVFSRAFAREVRSLEVQSLAADLSGFVDYAGGPVSEEDLNSLGIENVDENEINNYMDDEYLDELVKLVGIRRYEGAESTGSVNIETQTTNQVKVPVGLKLTTTPETVGEKLIFEVAPNEGADNFVFQSGSDSYYTNESSPGVYEPQISNIQVKAVEVGPEYNVPSNSIIRFESPPVGVKGVNNPSATTGGENIETNDELRERAKKSVQGTSEGGTVEGIETYIQQNVDNVRQGDVEIEEFFYNGVDDKRPFVDVIVDGGIDSEVNQAIEEARPVGIPHYLIRPQGIQLNVRADLVGTDINDTYVNTVIEEYLNEQGINDNLYKDQLIRNIMTSDNNIINIDLLDLVISSISRERFEYEENKDEYKLDFTYADNGSATIDDETGVTYTEGSEFEIANRTYDNYPETVHWKGSDRPEPGEDFFVDYDVTPVDANIDEQYKTRIVRDEEHTFKKTAQEDFVYDDGQTDYLMEGVPFPTDIEITDNSGDTYTTQDGDFEIVNTTNNDYKQTIRWLTSNTPDNNESFTALYDKKVYHLNHEIIETTEDEIYDDPDQTASNVYQEKIDFNIVDYDNDGEKDSVEWLSIPSGLNDDETFFITYIKEGDVIVDNREKVEPDTITVNTNV